MLRKRGRQCDSAQNSASYTDEMFVMPVIQAQCSLRECQRRVSKVSLISQSGASTSVLISSCQAASTATTGWSSPGQKHYSRCLISPVLWLNAHRTDIAAAQQAAPSGER